MAMFMWVSLWILFCSMDLYVCLFASTTLSLQQVLKSDNVFCLTLFIIKIVLAVRVHQPFQINLRISLQLKTPAGILIEIALNLQSNMGLLDIFTVLTLPVHDHGFFFQVFDLFHQPFALFTIHILYTFYQVYILNILFWFRAIVNCYFFL